MARVSLTIHDAPPELYERLAVTEQHAPGADWKALKTPSIEIVVFRPDNSDGDDA